MTYFLGTLIGLGIGELLYLLDVWFGLSGGSTPLFIQYIYGMFILFPFRLDIILKQSFLSWNVVLVLYYGFNGLIAVAIARSKIPNPLLKFVCFIGVFVLQIITALLFL